MEHISLNYDGLALQTHELDVRDLAPALLSLSDLLEISTEILCGKQAKSTVKVRGSFKSGSFGIDFTIAVDLLQRAKDLLNGDFFSANSNAVAAITSIISVFEVLRRLKNNKITTAQKTPNNTVILCTNEQNSLEISNHTFALLKDPRVNMAIDKLTSPLDRDGIDSFSITKNNDILFLATKADRACFIIRNHGLDEPIVQSSYVVEMNCLIITACFKEDNKWRLMTGDLIFAATMLDDAFLEQVHNSRISFSKGDTLLCRIRIQEWQTPNNNHKEYEILKVLEHRSANKQLDLLM